jgi:hypothetical protein
MNGTFLISLDFELHWGGFEKWPMPAFEQYFLNTRQIIPELLSLFAQHEIHVTWATVGMLFFNSRKDLLDASPFHKPSYTNAFLSAYNYIQQTGIGENEAHDPFHFAPSLIEKIIATPHQELGTHTFAHFYCNEPGQNVDQFRDDLRAAQQVAGQYNRCLRSLVFPRNQFNDQYLKVCYEEGIRSVRSNPLDWFWNISSTQNESLWKRINRGLDAYFPIGKKNTYRLDDLEQRSGFPVCIPASRLLRPYNPREFFLNEKKIMRILGEMTRAAKQNEIYHLWWHPHNFGNHPEESLAGLKTIIEHYAYCREKWRMNSLHMDELSTLIRNDN